MTTIPPSAINATIAELIEPLASLPVPENEGELWVWVESPKQCWSYLREDDSEWQPLDFLHDARGTVIIIKRMILDEDFEHFAIRIHDESYLSDLHDSEHWNMLVAHAFLRANGIEVSE